MAVGASTGPSNYPGGFASGVTLQNTPVSIPHPGRVFWVNNSSVLAPGGIGGSNSNDGTYLRPFSTLDYAVGKCTASRGDVIYVMPGYTQTMSAADAVDVDVAGVRIIGLGRGSLMPTFTYDNAAGEFVIGADNVRIEGLRFVPSGTGITHALNVEATFDHPEIVNCRFETGEAATTDEFLICVSVGTTANYGLIQGCNFDQGLAGATNAISLATPQYWTIQDNFIMGDYTACIATITGAGVLCVMRNNIVINGEAGNLNTTEVFTQSAAGTWFLSGNIFITNIATDLSLMFTNFTSTINGGNLYSDDSTMILSAVDRSAVMAVSTDT